MIRLDKVVNLLNASRYKITRRNKLISPVSNMVLFLIPLFTYTIGKLMGRQYNEREFLFPLIIVVLFIFWFFLNFKFVKNNTDEI